MACRPNSTYQRALITGASRGLGRAYAEGLPETTELLLTGRDAEALEETAAALRDAGRTVETVVADLATADGRDAVIAAAKSKGIDLLINNAGLGAFGEFADVPMERHEAVVSVNVTALLTLTHALIPTLVEQADFGGSKAAIVNLASSIAFVPVPGFATYAASKAFVLSFGEALAAELADDPIDVLTVCPGPTKTEFGTNAGYERAHLPGAIEPERVVDATLAAIGRQRTLVIDPLSKVAFTPAAFARNAISEVVRRTSRFAAQRGEAG
ncbi:SDR family NAD(P)-dependent oxidoreductase [Amorphus orientalis]|uniref:Short-subunit dehydrogenase n=1 Tax=Amorphus orientalis TaxID=649198 RepID=A0AAE4AU65_9HYPH|nr:SDR family NAD(P)-dependent oxidoreductase [Amorphus orientalis]MDQ0317010.1 short-subunit dehydrogenase [Amorphus orientalis]